MSRSVSVTWDYRCPFARNAHESVINAIEAGWDVDWTFVAFSLDQVHADADEPAVWNRPEDERGSGTLALTWGIAIRDKHPEKFLEWHRACFAARHDEGRRIQDESVLHSVAQHVGLDPHAVATFVASGTPLQTLRAEHTAAVEEHAVFGVPTFIENGHAAFVRMMERGNTDDLAEVLELLPSERINEFKRTRLPH